MSNENEKNNIESLQSKCLDCAKCGCYIGSDGRSNLECTNYLADIPGDDFDIVEVHFKNTRKGFYRNSAHLQLEIGDLVAVEANPGHDIGRISMMGPLVKLQMKKAKLKPDFEILRVFRKAKPADIERFEEAKAKEVRTMIRSREIAANLNLKMKIGDVEYQGDGNKAIFYYIADERVDFRQLIKVLADVFRIRVEMKQIGARQEAGRIGGIGPCGRPLCCASWMSNFVSVATSAARYQDISLNPQKLAGQCAKLKCCINFEVDGYVEATKQLPSRDIALETKDSTYFHFKTDIFKREITYSTDKHIPANLVTISADRVFEVIALNKQGVKPDKLKDDSKEHAAPGVIQGGGFGDIIGQDSISRFDKEKKKKKKGGRGKDKDRDNRPASNNADNSAESKQNTSKREGGNQPQGGNRNRQHGRRRGGNRDRRNNDNNSQNRNNGSTPNSQNQQ